MQDLLLYSHVPSARYSQVLHIFAGLTASQPRPIFEEHLVLEQLKLPPASKKTPANASQRRAYQHLVRRPNDASTWQHRIAEVPEPGFKQTLSQSVSEAPVPGTDLDKFRAGSEGYKPTAHYFVSGDRFVQGNIIISVTRIHQGDAPSETVIDSPPPTSVTSPPLDPSGSHIVETCIRLEDGSSTALRDQASKELLAFAETLKGAVDLRVPDRLALDPRVRGS